MGRWPEVQEKHVVRFLVALRELGLWTQIVSPPIRWGAVGGPASNNHDTVIAGPLNTGGDLRATIFIDGDLYIDQNIENDGGGPYFGFSDMGLIQLIVRGDIHVHPRVTRIDAALVAYPVWDSANPTQIRKGSIDLCAGPSDPLAHWNTCASNSSQTRQLVINGYLVAQRVYLNRLNETLKNRLTPPAAHPLGREPHLATQANTRASEVVVLMPHYHFITPAASVFDDWVKRPQAIFDIPAGL